MKKHYKILLVSLLVCFLSTPPTLPAQELAEDPGKTALPRTGDFYRAGPASQLVKLRGRGSEFQNQPPTSKLQTAIVFAGQSDRLVMASRTFRFGTGANTSASRPFGFSHDNQYFVFAKHDVLSAVNLATGTLSEKQLSNAGDDEKESRFSTPEDARLVHLVGFSSDNQSVYVSCESAQKSSIRKIAVKNKKAGSLFNEQSQVKIKPVKLRSYSFGISPNDDWLLAEQECFPYNVYDGDLSETKLEIRNFLKDGYFRVPGRRPKQGAGVSYDGSYFATVGTTVATEPKPPWRELNGDASLRIWASKDFNEIHLYDDKSKRLKDCTAVAFSPVDQTLVAGLRQPEEANRFVEGEPEPVGELVLIDLNSQQEKHRAKLVYQTDETGAGRRTRFLSFDHTGKLIIAVNSVNEKEHSIVTFTADKLGLKEHLSINGELHDVAVSPSSDHLAIATADGIVKILKISDLSEVVKFKHPKCGLLLFSPNGTLLACYDEDRKISLYDIKKLVAAPATE